MSVSSAYSQTKNWHQTGSLYFGNLELYHSPVCSCAGGSSQSSLSFMVGDVVSSFVNVCAYNTEYVESHIKTYFILKASPVGCLSIAWHVEAATVWGTKAEHLFTNSMDVMRI